MGISFSLPAIKSVSIRSFRNEKLPHTLWGQLQDNPVRTQNWLAKPSSGTQVPFYKPQIPFQKPCTIHSEPPLDNPVSQCTTQTATSPHLCSIVTREVKPSSCQILTSPPVQSKAVPGKQGTRQWQLMPVGRRLLALPSYLCPSPCRPHLSSSPAATFLCPHMVAENM